jgi:protein subunit release factor B
LKHSPTKGPGGQKINKTSNRVILIHRPTQLRVECQDTRSLQQNRKIARKRLKEKLDEHLNGSLSKLQQKHQKASQKRQRSKTKNRARHRKKQEEKRQKMLAEEAEVAPPLYE